MCDFLDPKFPNTFKTHTDVVSNEINFNKFRLKTLLNPDSVLLFGSFTTMNLFPKSKSISEYY